MKEALFKRLAALYERMQNSYEECAKEAGLSCSGCETNCCTSYFKHYTYIEWMYLWKGLRALPGEKRMHFIARSKDVVAEARRALSLGAIPNVMCPLNEDGLCALYSHRLMICRMHGTRNFLFLPSGERRVFQGCARFTTMHPASADPAADHVPSIDRTPFYQELATLEMELLCTLKARPPKVNFTLAEMLSEGAPRF